MNEGDEKMTNKEIKKLCEEKQIFHGCENYPNYKFKILQTEKVIRIYWEYLDGAYWILEKESLLVLNENREVMNDYLDYNSTIENTISSIIYYMVIIY